MVSMQLLYYIFLGRKIFSDVFFIQTETAIFDFQLKIIFDKKFLYMYNQEIPSI